MTLLKIYQFGRGRFPVFDPRENLLRENSLQARNGPQVTSPFEHMSEKGLVQRIHDRKYKVILK